MTKASKRFRRIKFWPYPLPGFHVLPLFCIQTWYMRIDRDLIIRIGWLIWGCGITFRFNRKEWYMRDWTLTQLKNDKNDH